MQFMQRAKQQMTVLRVLDEADGPLSARELWSRLSGTGVGLATVYRALQRGVEEGTLESVEGLGGGVRYEPRRNQLVFIGRNLDEQSMRQEFEVCLI